MSNPKLPWFPFYGNDFQASTGHWSDEQVGAYLRLLIAQSNLGSVPVDDLKAISRLSETAAKHPVVLSKFPNGVNARLEQEVTKAQNVVAKKSEQARKAVNARWNKAQHIDTGEYTDVDTTEHTPVPTDAYTDVHTGVDTGVHTNEYTNVILSTPTPTITSKTTKTPAGADAPRADKKNNPLDAKKKTETKTKPKITDEMWESFRRAYPDRAGAQGWGDAKVRATNLLANGVLWSDIMSGTRRYAELMLSLGNVGTPTVKAAKTFLSAQGQHWTEQYSQPATQLPKTTSANQATVEAFK